VWLTPPSKKCSNPCGCLVHLARRFSGAPSRWVTLDARLGAALKRLA